MCGITFASALHGKKKGKKERKGSWAEASYASKCTSIDYAKDYASNEGLFPVY